MLLTRALSAECEGVWQSRVRPLTSTACPSSRSKPTTQMQCSQAEKRSHGSRRAFSASWSPPSADGRVISSAGEMLLASCSSRSSGSSSGSPSSSGPCRAMASRRRHAGTLECWTGFSENWLFIPPVKIRRGKQMYRKKPRLAKNTGKNVRADVRAYVRMTSSRKDGTYSMQTIFYVGDCPLVNQETELKLKNKHDAKYKQSK